MTFWQAKMRICTRLLLTGAAGTLPRSTSSVSKYLTCHGGCKIYKTGKSLLSLTVPAARTRLFVPRPAGLAAAALLPLWLACRLSEGAHPGKTHHTNTDLPRCTLSASSGPVVVVTPFLCLSKLFLGFSFFSIFFTLLFYEEKQKVELSLCFPTCHLIYVLISLAGMFKTQFFSTIMDQGRTCLSSA